jgi:hypothetical protein
MDERVKRIKTAELCEIFATNAAKRGRPDLAQEAKVRAIELRAEEYGAQTAAENEAIQAVYAYEEVLSKKNGKRTRASRTWQMIKRRGIINSVERAVNRRSETQGYTALAEMGLKEFAFEAVILRYPQLFSDEAIAISQRRLRDWQTPDENKEQAIPEGLYSVLQGREEISNAQSLFSKRMVEGCDRVEEMNLGFQGGGLAATVHWSSDLDLWMALQGVEKRYWNAFGLGNPFESGSNSIVVEINSPYEGINRHVGGIFLKDDNGGLYLGHRGSVGGGRPGIGKEAFLDSSGPEQLMDFQDGDRVSEALFIGALDATDFPECVNTFVRQVQKFKETV